MKRIYMIIAAIAALTMTAQAQTWGSIEIGNAETATTYNGSYFDMAPTNFYVAHTGAQLLYTPDMLTELEGKQNVQIKGLTFMFHDETFEDIARNVKIYIQAVDATEFAVNEDGVKQFFPLGEQVWEEERLYEMMYLYGEDFTVSFRFNCNFTPGQSMLVTIVFDALEDDNCTMGSDYAPFYSSGISGKAMTYTNNWTSFVDYAEGSDFPNATASLGCGTNVDLPYTKIDYYYEESEDITLLSQANELEDYSEFTFNGNAVVTVFNNGYLFLRDESGYAQISGVEGTFENGQVLSEGWSATKTTITNGWVKYIDAAGLSASGETNTELAAAVKLTAAPDESLLNAYVVIENAVPGSGGGFPGLPQHYYVLEDGSKLYKTDCLWAMDEDAGQYNLYGIICKDGGKLKINPVAFEPYVEPQGLRGDVDKSGEVTIADVTALIDYLLNAIDASQIDVEAANCNGDDSVTIADVTALIDYLLNGEWAD